MQEDWQAVDPEGLLGPPAAFEGHVEGLDPEAAASEQREVVDEARFKPMAIFETLNHEGLRARMVEFQRLAASAAAVPRGRAALALACAAGGCCALAAGARLGGGWRHEARAGGGGGSAVHRELMRPAEGAALASASPVDGFVPVGRGTGVACRSEGPDSPDGCDGDEVNRSGCTVFTKVAKIDECKDLCSREEACTGIEYSSEFQRCEVWKLNLGAGASVEGFQCFAYHRPCSAVGESCLLSGCCLDVGSACYQKDEFWAGCRSECVPGESDSSGPDEKPWSCTEVQKPGRSNGTCAAMGENCSGTGCCNNPALGCFEKTSEWAGCRRTCEPGQPDPSGSDDQPWSCKELAPRRRSGSAARGGLHVLGAGGGATAPQAEDGARGGAAAGHGDDWWQEWAPAGGGPGHCYAEGSKDIVPTEAHKFASLDRCKLLCRALETCTGIEYSAGFGYCELWQMPIKSSIPGNGFVCLSLLHRGFEAVAAVAPSRFRPLDGGINRACSPLDRGLRNQGEDMAIIMQSGNDQVFPGDEAQGRLRLLEDEQATATRAEGPEQFDGVVSLGDCQERCVGKPGCTGIGYAADKQRCSVWTVAIESTTDDEGSVCLSFADQGAAEGPPSTTADAGAEAAHELEAKLAKIEEDAEDEETADGLLAEALATVAKETEREEAETGPQATRSPTFLCIAVVPEEAASAETKLLKHQFESSTGIFSCEGSTLFFGRDMGKIFERIQERSSWSNYDWTIVVHTNVVFDASRFGRVASLLQTDIKTLHQQPMYYVRHSHSKKERGPIEIISNAAFQALFNCSSTSTSHEGIDPYEPATSRCMKDGGVQYESYPWLIGDAEKTGWCTDSSTFAFSSSFSIKEWTKCSDAAADLPSEFLEV